MTETFRFRCTYCEALIPWAITKADLGIKPEDEYQNGQVYPYEKCNCGWGKFVKTEGKTAAETPHRPVEESEGMIRERIEQATYAKIPLKKIKPNAYQPRKFFDAEALRALAESIRKVGLLEDIIVRPVDDHYEIVLGERRWRASSLLDTETISAKVLELDDESVQLIAITENVHREDLSKVEEAFAYKHYIDEGKQLTEVGQYLGNMDARVAERLKVLNSRLYIEYQEERIKELQEKVDHLRDQINLDAKPASDSRIVGTNEITDYLNQGYDVLAVIDTDRIIIRRNAKLA